MLNQYVCAKNVKRNCYVRSQLQLFEEKLTMTNLEYIRKCDKGELAKLLCTIASPKHTVNCGMCIVKDYCYELHNGFLHWLDMKRNKDEWN